MNIFKDFLDKFLLLSIFFLSIILIYIFYKSEIINNGSIRDYYTIFYKIIIFLIIIFSSVFFLKKVIKLYFVITFLTIFFSVYLFEFYVTYNLSKIEKHRSSESEKIFYKNTKKKFDNRSNLTIYSQMRKENEDITLALLPKQYDDNILKIFPLGNISNTKTIFCNENGYYSIYKSDRYGFNNPDVEWDRNKIEYFLLGDSFVHGSCVNRPNDIASNLRKLSNKSVLNLGYKGNGALTHLGALKEYLPKNVKNVIWFYFTNDVWDLKRELDSPILKNYLTDETFKQNLKVKQNSIDDFLKADLKSLITANMPTGKNKKFQRIIKIIKLDNVRKFIFKPKLQIEFIHILKKAKYEIAKNNSNFYFVYLPSYNSIKINKYDEYFHDIKEILFELKIPLIDIKKELFDDIDKPLDLFPFGLGGHYNDEGYKAISKIIYKYTNN